MCTWNHLAFHYSTILLFQDLEAYSRPYDIFHRREILLSFTLTMTLEVIFERTIPRNLFHIKLETWKSNYVVSLWATCQSSHWSPLGILNSLLQLLYTFRNIFQFLSDLFLESSNFFFHRFLSTSSFMESLKNYDLQEKNATSHEQSTSLKLYLPCSSFCD